MSGNEEQKDDVYINQLDDEFDFVDAFDDQGPSLGDDLLPENTAVSAINAAFIGVGGGGVPAIEAVAVLTTANLEAGIGDAITEVIVGAGVRCILIDGKWVCTT